jgi:hypothetical protein
MKKIYLWPLLIKRSRLVSPDFKWSGLDLLVRISNGKNKMAAKTRWPTIQNILASLHRFINKGHKNILFMPKQSRLASGFFCLDFKWSGFQIVRLSNGPAFKWSSYRMPGTGIRYNPNTTRGSVFGGLLYQTSEIWTFGIWDTFCSDFRSFLSPD